MILNIGSDDIVFTMDSVINNKSNVEKKLKKFLLSINNDIADIAGNNDTQKVVFHFKNEITEEEAEQLKEVFK